MWQESCRRCCVAVASRGISQMECVPCLLQPRPCCSQHMGVVKKLLLMQVGGQPDIPEAVGGLKGVEDADSGRLCFHKTGPGVRLPVVPRLLKARDEGAPVEVELCALVLGSPAVAHSTTGAPGQPRMVSTVISILC